MTSYPPEYPGYTPPPPTGEPTAPAPYAEYPTAVPGTPAYPPPYPATPYATAPYPQVPYPPAPYAPAGAPLPPYPPQPGYLPPGYAGYGYPVPSGRPGNAVASAVLAYVAAGLLIFCGIWLAAASSGDGALHDQAGFTSGNHAAEWAIDALANFAAAALLIAGGVQLAGRRANGRLLLWAGTAITVVAGIYWMTRFDWAIVWALIFCSLVVVSAGLAAGATITRWLEGNRPPR